MGLALGLVAGGCAKDESAKKLDNVVTPTFGGPTTSKPKPQYQPVYQQQETCPVKGVKGIKNVAVVCGTLTVPENRDDPKKRKVTLQVVTLKSTSPTPKPDPVVYLEGGPGGSALAALELWTNPPSPLLADRDVIFVDQRGTGYSDPRLSCDFEFATATRSEQEVQLMGDCYERLNGAKIDLSHYTTSEIGADIADLRTALGLQQWNLFGVSYGTRLALQIMAEHPEGIRSVVLDSTYPAGVKAFADIPADAYRAFRAIFDACAADPSCASRYPNLETRLGDAINQLNDEPLKVRRVTSDGELQPFEFTGADLAQFLFQASYIADAIRVIPRAITLSANGQTLQGLNLLADALPTIVATPEKDVSNRRPSQSDGLHYTVQCAEEAPLTTPAELEARSAEIPEPLKSALLKSAKQNFEICQSWKVPPRQLAETTADIPTLVLAGSMDPITPPAWGQLAASRLPKAQLVQVDGAGHGVYFTGECGANLVTSFINDPTAPAGGCAPITGFR
ncbi:MAG: alpha/beta hydrolase [Acidimicrobiales bacterium]